MTFETSQSNWLVSNHDSPDCSFVLLRLCLRTCLLLGVLSLAGCSMYRQAFNNLVIAPTEFALLRDQKSTERLHQSLAREAFEELQREHPRRQLTTDYRDGFEHGYNAYLTTGGDTSPALLPPRKYWSVKWRTGTENEAARNWLAGERDGREHAAASGLRTLATAPSSLELEPDEGNPPESQIEELPALSGKPKLKPGSDAAKSDSRSATVDRGRIN